MLSFENTVLGDLKISLTFYNKVTEKFKTIEKLILFISEKKNVKLLIVTY